MGNVSCCPDRQNENGLCFLKPKEGFYCPTGITLCTKQNKVPDENMCPSGYDYQKSEFSVSCVAKCPEGFIQAPPPDINICYKPRVDKICTDPNYELINDKCVEKVKMDVIVPANNLPNYNASYNSLANFCNLQGKKICNKNDICDGYTPKSNVLFSDKDNWVAIGDSQNEWLTLYNSLGRQCKTHTEIAGVKPTWGIESKQTGFDRAVKCCNISDVLISNSEISKQNVDITVVQSPDGINKLVYQKDGNLAWYSPKGSLVSNTNGIAQTKLAFHTDGNLVIYNNTTPIWSLSSYGPSSNGPFTLKALNDGNLVIYDKNNSPKNDVRSGTSNNIFLNALRHY